MAEEIYVCKEGSSNKFWSHTITGNSVLIKWGRLGLAGESQVKEFPTASALQRFLDGKIKEKVKKGYTKTTMEEKKAEEKTAQQLGHQYKINLIKWVEKRDNRLIELLNYDSKQFVYVEVLNSWSKEVTRLLLNKKDSWQIEGVAFSNREIEFEDIRQIGSTNFVVAIRDVLKKMFAKVAVVAVKFAAVGARLLDLGNDEEVEASPQVAEIYTAVQDTTVSKQVVAVFAAMGNRVLDLD